MKPLFLVLFLSVFSASRLAAQQDSATIVQAHKATVEKIIRMALSDSLAFKRLATMCDTYGARLSGTENLERSIDWVLAELKKDNFQNVRGEPVMVPRWVRGREYCRLISPRVKTLEMLGLGGSIATPEGGITAEVLVVKNFDELDERAAEAKGKIVLFNTPFTEYRETVRVRVQGAMRAASAGAVASLIRSVGPFSMNTPHTGGMTYADTIKKIPHAAIAAEDAEMLARMASRKEKLTIEIFMSAQTLPDAASRNVVAEIKGTEKPNEILVFGGHIDSWDVGSGAMDDAGGCFAAWHALLTIKRLGLKPKRTIRLVMWTNEENGMRGGETYAEAHKDETHVFALESDAGVFKPEGFGFVGAKDLFPKARAIASLLEPVGATKITVGGGGADIGPLMRKGVPGMGLDVDGTKYFWYHHTNADTPDKLNPREINECAAAMAVMMFLMSESL
jgi:carboxypeptidase Q